tara:strand:+ start:1457 stop:3397 length:1941 start_codon:yes stop_codon:yes gene_type:complete
MALSNLTKVQTLGIGSNIEVVGVITTGEFKSGTSNLHSTGVELTNLNVSGVGTIGGNLSVGGVLTYEDVTNIDSVGVVTAREGIFIPDNKKIHLGNASGSGDLQIYHTGAHSYIADEGVGELIISGNRVQLMNAARSGKLFDSVEGASGYLKLYQNNNVRLEATNTGATITGDITISDKIIHAGDTNTALRFPSADTITAETGGSERVRIDSSGSVGIGTDNPAKKLEVFDATQGVIRIRGGAGGSDSSRKADLSLFASGAREYVVRADASDAAFKIIDVSDSNAERLRITSTGLVGINEASPDTKLHVRNGVLKIETDTNFYSGSGENGENYASIFLNANHSSGNNPAHGKITVRHSNQNTYSGDLVLMPQGYYSGSYGYQEVLRVSAYKRVGINEPNPSAELDVQGDGPPVNINSSNSNSFKIKFEDNGTVRGYIGCDNTNLLNLGNSSAASKFTVNTAGIAHNVDTTTHGSGVYMCEVHTDLLALLKSSTNHGNQTGMYYSWPDGGGASWTWDNGVLRMDSNVGSHNWQCGAVHLTPGYYTLMQCWRASPDAHGWSNFGSNSNGNAYYLTDDLAYGSYNTLLTSYAGQAPRNDGKTYWYGTTSGNFWHYVSSAGTYRIQQMGQPYGSGGYKYYILAAYLLKLK